MQGAAEAAKAHSRLARGNLQGTAVNQNFKAGPVAFNQQLAGRGASEFNAVDCESLL